LDFDIDEPGSNRVYHRDGGNWFWYPNEVNDVKNPTVNRVWFVRNERTGHGVWVRPGPHDGMPDGFSRIDVGVRRFHDAEDRGWWWGAWGGLQYLDGESVDNTDLVFWYVGHLEHHAGEGGDAWHDCGPNLQVHL